MFFFFFGGGGPAPRLIFGDELCRPVFLEEERKVVERADLFVIVCLQHGCRALFLFICAVIVLVVVSFSQ